jgi:hypothetical protein
MRLTARTGNRGVLYGSGAGGLLRQDDVMTQFFKVLAISSLLLVSPSAVHAQVSVGIHIGEPPAPHAYVVHPQPGPDYMWVEGYQYPERGHYVWHNGYWTRPPYQGAYWVQPYHLNGQYYAGQWEGDRGNVTHNHRWDRSKQRDDGRNDRH